MIEDKTHISVKVGEKTMECFCEKSFTVAEAYQAFDMLRAYFLGRLKEAEAQPKASDGEPESVS